MGNFATTLKRFFKNKNTVTILGVIAGVIVLWVFYNRRVNQAISPQLVPVATKELHAKDEITEKDIEYVKMSSLLLKKAKVHINKKNLIGKYVNVGTSIPVGGMFYISQVVDGENLPNTITDEIPEGDTLFKLKINNNSLYKDAFYPGNKIDLYLYGKEEGSDLIINECFIKSIKVLAVIDSSDKNVFDSVDKRVPAFLLFSVPNDMFKLLTVVNFLPNMELYPVPRNKQYTDSDEKATIANAYLQRTIESKIANIAEGETEE